MDENDYLDIARNAIDAFHFCIRKEHVIKIIKNKFRAGTCCSEDVIEMRQIRFLRFEAIHSQSYFFSIYHTDAHTYPKNNIQKYKTTQRHALKS